MVYMFENPPVGLRLTESDEEKQSRKDKEKRVRDDIVLRYTSDDAAKKFYLKTACRCPVYV